MDIMTDASPRAVLGHTERVSSCYNCVPDVSTTKCCFVESTQATALNRWAILYGANGVEITFAPYSWAVSDIPDENFGAFGIFIAWKHGD